MLNKIDSKFRIIGDIPIQDPAETSQFERVLALLREAAGRIGPWCIVVLDVLYYHNRGKVIDDDNDWNSQIDILVFSENRIIAYELKGFTAKIIYGKTDNQDWIIKRRNSTKTNKVPSFFKQASKHHAFLVRDFLPEYRDNHPQLSENHWIVDARVVLKPESDLSGFSYGIPSTIFKDKFESDVIIRIQSVSGREFIRKFYSGIEEETGKLHSVKVSPDELSSCK